MANPFYSALVADCTLHTNADLAHGVVLQKLACTSALVLCLSRLYAPAMPAVRVNDMFVVTEVSLRAEYLRPFKRARAYIVLTP